MKLGFITVTAGGRKLALSLIENLAEAILLPEGPKKGQKIADTVAENWHEYDGFVFIMAAGIVVRSIAPLLKHKHNDPCVIVMDESGSHVVSLLSGHIGGGNQLARHLATLTEGVAVITTGSDTLGLVALDLWAKAQRLTLNRQSLLTKASSKLVSYGRLRLYTDLEVQELPGEFSRTEDWQEADIIVSHRDIFPPQATVFRPRNLVIGVGCNRGTPADEFADSLAELMKQCQLSPSSIRNLASIDKKNDETGLLQFARKNNWSIDFFDKDAINELKNIEISFAALKAVGAIGVAEPCALISGNTHLLLSRKRKWKNITMAIAQAPFTLSAQALDRANI